jgi:dTDP-4-dehydrorhamnose reductase
MIALIGSTGYVGSAFRKELTGRDLAWIPYHHWEPMEKIARNPALALIINCAGYIPTQSVSLCDNNPQETIRGNLILPTLLAERCREMGIPFAQVSTGCLWGDGLEHKEDDPPQRVFKGYCGFYVGIKSMAEDEVRKHQKHYIWRIRLPFDEVDSPRNYLTKLCNFDKVWDHTNSLSHLGDFVKACLDLWQLRAPWGTYNVMNPGSVRAMDIVEKLMARGLRKSRPLLVQNHPGDTQCNVDKLLAAGVKIRPVKLALEESLEKWTVPSRYVPTSHQLSCLWETTDQNRL